MKKGFDYTGITVSFFCHDGEGKYVLHRRNQNCRDEHGRWDFGSGGLKFGETLEQCLLREVAEEYGVKPIRYEFMGHDEIFREHDGKQTHWIAFRYLVLVEREKVINGEPHKHDELSWFSLDALPEPLHSQVPYALEKYKDKLSKN